MQTFAMTFLLILLIIVLFALSFVTFRVHKENKKRRLMVNVDSKENSDFLDKTELNI